MRRSGKVIVENINWEVKPGECWVLLGPNGIGKSSLINILSARIFPTAGSAELFGFKFGETDLFKLRPRVGVLGADLGSAFPASETVLNLVALAPSGMTGTWGDARDAQFLNEAVIAKADEMLDLFGVEHLRDSYWGVLSQGERKRVQMARVMMLDPELLLLDEPTAGLDLAGREYVINVLNKLAAGARIGAESAGEGGAKPKRRAILLVNHNVEEIPPSFDRVALMGRAAPNDANSPGELLFQGDIRRELNSANLSRAYGIDLSVQRMQNLRYFASTSVIIDKKARLA